MAAEHRNLFLDNEHETVTRVSLKEEFGGRSFMMSDNSADGADPILDFLFRTESHVMDAFYRSMDPKSCDSNKQEGLTAFTADCLQPRDDGRIWMADVGSNSGFYGQMVAALGYPVVQIDPQPHCAQYVRAATLASGFGDRVVALNAFAGDKSVASFDTVQQRTGCWGTFPFLTNDQLQSLKVAMAKSPGWEDPVPVPMIRLDDVVFGSGSGSEDSRDVVIGAMKVDVEGSEDKMLLGAERLLSEGRIYHIIMELNKPAWKSAKVSHETAVAMLVRLAGYGFKCRLSNYGGWPTQANFDMSQTRLTELMTEGWLTIDMWCSLAADRRYKLPAA
jgi:FkbM family methyltransferase